MNWFEALSPNVQWVITGFAVLGLFAVAALIAEHYRDRRD